MYTITIDAGTTNTRAYLWAEGPRLAASARAETGVHQTAMDGNNRRLKQAVRGCLEELLRQGGIGYEQVGAILASGMITSNVGLAEVPHVPAPAGAEELARGSRRVLLEDICPVPIRFIPGVKNNLGDVTLDNFEAMDMMRGEEVETLAILASRPKGEPCLLVLPGSHTKFVAVDGAGKITGCLTTITGELLECLTCHTVIADAVGRRFADEESYHRELLLKGFQASSRTGISRGAFSARILNQFAEKDKGKMASFLLGAALGEDVRALRGSRALRPDERTPVIVSGKNPLRQALFDILRFDGFFRRVEQYVPDSGLPLSALGSFLVADVLERENMSGMSIM